MSKLWVPLVVLIVLGLIVYAIYANNKTSNPSSSSPTPTASASAYPSLSPSPSPTPTPTSSSTPSPSASSSTTINVIINPTASPTPSPTPLKYMEEVKTEEQVTTVSRSAPAQVTRTTKTVTPPPVQTEHPQKVYDKKKAIFRSYQVIWYITGIIEIVLAFRIFLRMTGAYPSGFTNLIYLLSSPFALPFRGVIKTSVDEGPVMEWSTFIAMLVYLIIALGLVQLFQFLKPVTPEEVEKEVDSK